MAACHKLFAKLESYWFPFVDQYELAPLPEKNSRCVVLQEAAHFQFHLCIRRDVVFWLAMRLQKESGYPVQSDTVEGNERFRDGKWGQGGWNRTFLTL